MKDRGASGNETNGGSIYVLKAPLDYQERPTSTKFSQGRFIVRSAGFLNPEVYRTGARITIAGELSGTETHNVGKTNYPYPAVTLREVYFWGREPCGYPAYAPWGWGWYGPYGPQDEGFSGYYYYPGHNYRDYDHDEDLDRRFDRSRPEGEEGEHERR